MNIGTAIAHEGTAGSSSIKSPAKRVLLEMLREKSSDKLSAEYQDSKGIMKRKLWLFAIRIYYSP